MKQKANQKIKSGYNIIRDREMF